MEPGPVLAVFLGHIDVDRCTGYDRIRVLKAQDRLLSWIHSQRYHTMSSIVDTIDPDDMCQEYVEEEAAIEIAAALRLTRRASETEVGFALDLQRRLPRLWDALQSGDIDTRRAWVIIKETSHLSIGEARRVVDDIIEDAGRLTSGQIGHRLRKLCFEANPDDAKERYDSRVEDRYVALESNPDGTANLFAMNLTADRANAAMDRVNHFAKTLPNNGETRTADQLRADVFLDIFDGTGPGSKTPRGGVHLHTDIRALAELCEQPGELAGYGPVISEVARQIAKRQIDTPWDWTLHNPETGMVIAEGTVRRRPNTPQQRHVIARDRTCVHPGCRMPAINSDIDHTIAYSESKRTHTEDLAPLCRYHHGGRDRQRWSYRRTANGDYVFTSHTGHRYTTSGLPANQPDGGDTPRQSRSAADAGPTPNRATAGGPDP